MKVNIKLKSNNDNIKPETRNLDDKGILKEVI